MKPNYIKLPEGQYNQYYKYLDFIKIAYKLKSATKNVAQTELEILKKTRSKELETLKTDYLQEKKKIQESGEFTIMEGNNNERTIQDDLGELEILKKEYQGEIQKKTIDEWEVLLTAQNDNGSLKYGYKAVAFINKSTKEIHISTAGTDPWNPSNLAADLLSFFSNKGASGRLNSLPYEHENIEQFVDAVLAKMQQQDNEPSEYTFSTSGHSLGAMLSDLTLLYMMKKDLRVQSSTTYENPGPKGWIDLAHQKYEMNNIHMNTLKEHCIVYNARPNKINASGNVGTGTVFKNESAHIADNIYVVHAAKFGETSVTDYCPKTHVGKLIEAIARNGYKIVQHLLTHFDKAKFIDKINGKGKDWNLNSVPLKLDHLDIAKRIC